MLGEQPGSLQEQCSQPCILKTNHRTGVRPDLILANIMKRVKAYYSLLQADITGDAANRIAERYAHSLFRREGFHRYADAEGDFLARLLRIESDGRFVLEDLSGKERGYRFKEVQYIL